MIGERKNNILVIRILENPKPARIYQNKANPQSYKGAHMILLSVFTPEKVSIIINSGKWFALISALRRW
jgi:hypothetical protein